MKTVTRPRRGRSDGVEEADHPGQLQVDRQIVEVALQEGPGLLRLLGVRLDHPDAGEILLGLRRQPSRIRGEKGKRSFFVFAVFGQIEVDPPNQVPSRIQGFKEIKAFKVQGNCLRSGFIKIFV